METIQLGFNLDSPDSDARKIDGENLTNSDPHYFADYTVLIAPGAQQVFNLFAQNSETMSVSSGIKPRYLRA